RDAYDDVVAFRPGAGAEQAAAEVATLVARATGLDLDPHVQPLEAAGLCVQEDLCVLMRGDGHWRLEAGVVCFPSMWRLAEKLGLPVTAIHQRVPYYGEE